MSSGSETQNLHYNSKNPKKSSFILPYNITLVWNFCPILYYACEYVFHKIILVTPAALAADNPSSHSIGGSNACFEKGSRKCRFCLATREDIKNNFLIVTIFLELRKTTTCIVLNSSILIYNIGVRCMVLRIIVSRTYVAFMKFVVVSQI
jgi:hypothetical protein